MTQTVRLSSKGQLTLPAAVRDELGLRQGDYLSVGTQNGQITLTKAMTLDEITALAMSWIAPGTPPVKDVDAYYQAHRQLTDD